jgi:nucleoside-diphosphate-sugar epimerase
MTPKVLVTGATGFIGKALIQRLIADAKIELLVALRRKVNDLPAGVASVQVGGIGPTTNWQPALAGIDVVIHAAARVHVMNDSAADPLAQFFHVNVGGTLNLARQAAMAGARRFIFISSIKVNGEETAPGKFFTAEDPPAPVDLYGISKLKAENGLRRLGKEFGMEVVIIRPPLVYGPGVKANFLTMLRWLHRRLPLPLGAIHNQRSLVALENLVDLIVTCINHPAAANQIFLAGDGKDLSTSDLLRRLGKELGKPALLLPVPAWAVKAAAMLLGKETVAQRLCGSLQVDISKTRRLLAWTPPTSVDDALHTTARYFLESHA